MKKMLTISMFVAAIACATLPFTIAMQQMARAQEEASEVERSIETDEDAFKPEAAERRLDAIERLIEQAESDGNEDRVRDLRREGERLLDRVEEFERSQLIQNEDDEEEWDEDEEELERHQRRMELHTMELEFERLRLERLPPQWPAEGPQESQPLTLIPCSCSRLDPIVTHAG